MAWRAYPAILCVALASCNQIFGLNDPVGFVDAAPGPGDARFGDCIDDTFDQLDLQVWQRLVPSVAGIRVDVVGGELAIEGMASQIGEAGISSGGYDFRDGSVSVQLTDLLTQADVVAAFEVVIGGAFLAITRDKDMTSAISSVSGGSAGNVFAQPDPHWRIRHDAASQLVVFETSADGVTFFVRHGILDNLSLSPMTVSLKAGFNAISASDRIAFDNLKLTALCPP
jgi:hypothetical protein